MTRYPWLPGTVPIFGDLSPVKYKKKHFLPDCRSKNMAYFNDIDYRNTNVPGDVPDFYLRGLVILLQSTNISVHVNDFIKNILQLFLCSSKQLKSCGLSDLFLNRPTGFWAKHWQCTVHIQFNYMIEGNTLAHSLTILNSGYVWKKFGRSCIFYFLLKHFR